MKTWSVELEANTWNDDTFNGSFDECIKYCKDHDYKINGSEARLTLIETDEKGTVVFTHEIYTGE